MPMVQQALRTIKTIKKILLVLLGIGIVIAGYFLIGKAPQQNHINWGVTFSQKHATNLGLDWKETYVALLQDLQIKHLRLIAYWDLVEPEPGVYKFEDLDWQVKNARMNNAGVTLVMGMRVPRWPECHVPDWAKGLSKEQQQEKILDLLKAAVLHFRHVPTIKYWQVENEPFFAFGECPWSDRSFLKKEIDLVRSLDNLHRPIIETESGEWSPWTLAAQYGDIVGVTMYRKAYFSQFHGYLVYPLTPVFYWRKAQIIQKFFHREVIPVEVQAEPWGPKLLYDTSVEEQQKTMNPEQFKNTVEFAKRTGFKEFYLWGGEWWYWMKVKQNDSRIWDQAKSLFRDSLSP